MPTLTNWYQVFYDTINDYVFGGSIIENTYPDLMAHIMCMIMTFAIVAIPFAVIWWSIKLIFKAFERFL